MVRTADSALRVTGGKSSKKGGRATEGSAGAGRRTSPGSSDRDSSGGLNPICPRETPAWQKPITNFFTTIDKPAFDQSAGKEKLHISKDGEAMDEDAQEGNKENCVADKKVASERIEDAIMDEGIAETENGKATEAQMKEPKDDSKRKSDAREYEDDDVPMVPMKKIKLDKSAYKNLQNLENC